MRERSGRVAVIVCTDLGETAGTNTIRRGLINAAAKAKNSVDQTAIFTCEPPSKMQLSLHVVRFPPANGGAAFGSFLTAHGDSGTVAPQVL